MPKKDMETHNNILMINAVKEHGVPLLWYKQSFDVNDFVTDQSIWRLVSQKTRLKITWLKEHWFLVRERYRHDRQAEIRDPSLQRTNFLEKYGEHLVFLESNENEWETFLCGESPSKTNSKTCTSDDSGIEGDKSEFENARKRLASQIEDVEFLKTVKSKLQKFELTEKEQLKKDILDMLNEK